MARSGRRLSKRQTLVRFLCSYLLVLIIPLITLMVTYFTAQRFVREETQRYNSAASTQIVHDFELLFDLADSIIAQICSDTGINSSIYNEELGRALRPFQRWQLQKTLSAFNNVSFSDIFLYYGSNDYIISNVNPGLQSHEYFNQFYRVEGDTSDICGSFLYEISLSSAKNNIRSLQGGAGEDLLYISRNLPTERRGGGSVTIVLMLSQKEVQRLLESASVAKGSALLLLDRYGRPLTASKGVPEGLHLPEGWATGQSYLQKIGSVDYLLRPVDSSTGCTFVFVSEQTVYYSRLLTLRTIGIVSISLCLVISLLIVMLLTKKNYSPLTDLVRAISDKSQLQNNSGNEYEFIHSAFEHIDQERRVLSDELALWRVARHKQIVRNLLEGTLSPAAGSPAALQEIGLQLDWPVFCVVLYEEDSKAADRAGGFSQLGDELALALHEAGCAARVYSAALTAERHACLLNLPEGVQQEQVVLACESARAKLSAHGAGNCSAGVSGFCSALAQVAGACSQAGQALDLRFVVGTGCTTCYEQTVQRVFEYHTIAQSRYEQMLADHVRGGKTDAKAIVEEMLASAMDRRHASLKAAKCFQYDMINLLLKIAESFGEASESERSGIMTTLTNAPTLDDFCALYVKLLGGLAEEARTGQQRNRLCERVIECIERDYADPNLNISTLSDSVGISMSYLAKLFRQQTGLKPLDYLSSVRIEKAKHLLYHSDDTLEEIAQKTGFISSNALIRVFKRFEGITPGAYKKLTEYVS